MRLRDLMTQIAGAICATRPCLVHRDTFGAMRVFRLDRPAVVGSGLEATVRIADPTVSRTHCSLYPVADPEGFRRWFISDLGSLNGTWLNGRRVSPRGMPTPIRSGDCIRLGRTQTALVLLDEESPDGAARFPAVLARASAPSSPRDSGIGLAAIDA